MLAPPTKTAWVVLYGVLVVVAFIWMVLYTRRPASCEAHREYVRIISSYHLSETKHPTTGDETIGEDLKRFFDLNPNVDKSPPRSDLEDVQRQFPNLPVAFWNDHKDQPMYYKNQSCAPFPSIFDLKYVNKYWQVLRTENGTFQLFGAYYEARDLSQIKPAVRILAMINRIAPTVKTFCQLWFQSSKETVFGEVVEYNYLWKRGWGNDKEGIYQPYLIACKIPTEYEKEVPASVSLVEKKCDMASNHLKVIYNKLDVKKDFAVCVKGLNVPQSDLSVRIAEWIEVLGSLGADKIFFYELEVHSNISKVLQYYKELGRVDVTPLTLSGEQPSLPALQHMYLSNKVYHKRQNDLIPYNDCFYKNMYSYRYIILLDIDEVIVPVSASSWKELMDVVEDKSWAERNETRAFYSAQNVYFFDDYPDKLGWFEDIPRYMHILQHVYRSKNFTKPGEYVKNFFNSEIALGLHNNVAFSCLTSNCHSYSISTNEAQLQHYCGDCAKELQNVCHEYRKNVVTDTKIWKIKNSVIKRTITTLKNLGYF